MKVYGLTGNFGVGKSTVSRILRVLGARVIDADEVARAIVEPGQPAWEDIVEEFGPEVLNCDSTLNRKRVAEIAFSDPGMLGRLNSITHPRIIAHIRELVEHERQEGAGVVLIEAALIVEKGGLKDLLDGLIVVTAPIEAQVRRLCEERGFSEEEARARIESQMPEEEKVLHATYVIDNSGTRENTARQVDGIWREIAASPNED